MSPTGRATVEEGRPMGRRLGREYFDRSTVLVARDLLGAEVWVGRGPTRRGVRIVETEAYVAHDDASHARRGRTSRNRSMFERPGTLYVFRIHQVVCANLVTRSAEAVLLRAGEPIGMPGANASGPGRLCRVLGLTLADDGIDATVGRRLAVYPARAPPAAIWVGPRVGISRARELPLRFAVIDSPHVSGPRPARIGRRRSSTSASPSRSRGAARSPRNRTKSRPPSGGGRSGVRSGGR